MIHWMWLLLGILHFPTHCQIFRSPLQCSWTCLSFRLDSSTSPSKDIKASETELKQEKKLLLKFQLFVGRRGHSNGFSQSDDSSQVNAQSQNPLTQIGTWGGLSQPGLFCTHFGIFFWIRVLKILNFSGALSAFSQTGFSQLDLSQDPNVLGSITDSSHLFSQVILQAL